MTRRTLLHLCMLAIIATLGIISSNSASAQLPCTCPRIPVIVAADVDCRIIACSRTNGGEFCDTVAPGTTGHLPCNGQFHVYLVGCGGQHFELDTNCNSGTVIPIRPGCCVHACLRLNPLTGCWEVIVRRALPCHCL